MKIYGRTLQRSKQHQSKSCPLDSALLPELWSSNQSVCSFPFSCFWILAIWLRVVVVTHQVLCCCVHPLPLENGPNGIGADRGLASPQMSGDDKDQRKLPPSRQMCPPDMHSPIDHHPLPPWCATPRCTRSDDLAIVAKHPVCMVERAYFSYICACGAFVQRWKLTLAVTRNTVQLNW